MTTETKSPVRHVVNGTTNREWWPNQLKIELLHQHSTKSNPMGEDFNYAKEFQSLDLAAVKKDLAALMTTRKIGGRPTSVTMARCSFAWPGTAPAPTERAMVVAAAAVDSSGSPRSTAGPTT